MKFCNKLDITRRKIDKFWLRGQILKAEVEILRLSMSKQDLKHFLKKWIWPSDNFLWIFTHFLDQYMIWTMKKEAIHYKKSFGHTPGASKRPELSVFSILMQKIWHFSKNSQNQFWPMLKCSKFYAEFEFDIRFYWNYVFW